MQPIDSTFSVPPFPAFPSVSRYVPLGSVQEAVDRVCRSIDAREGVALVLGPPGTGKSLVCGILADRYRQSHDVVVLGNTPSKDSTAFQRHLLHQLGADIEKIDASDLQLALIDRVCDAESPQDGLLILVDEAQSLSAEVIESIRMATNIMRDGQPRVFAVLCGNVTLEDTLVATSLEAFTQRVSTRCYLHAMNVEETRAYICETIRQCGADPDNTITSEAIAAVHHACMGVPRLVNQIMTEAVDCAAAAGQMLMDEQVIERAWAQLQQLPSPMVEEPRILSDTSTVEFGELADVSSEVESPMDHSSDLADTPEADDTLTDLEIVDATSLDSCEIESCCNESCGNESCSIDQDSMESAPTAPAPLLDPCQATPVASISPTELFGEFDVEEDVTIGNAIRSAEVKTTVDDGTAIESVLHQEVIGLSALATGGLELYHDSCEQPRLANDADHGCADGPEQVVEDFVVEPIETEASQPDQSSEQQNASEKGLEPEIRELPTPQGWPANFDDSSDSGDQSIGDDDSDMLVIEDEVHLTRLDEVKRVDAREQTISVDFQAMLSRMRTSV